MLHHQHEGLHCLHFIPCSRIRNDTFVEQVTCHIINMKVFIVFAAICFLAVAMAQEGGEEEGKEYVNDAAIREARLSKGVCVCVRACVRVCVCVCVNN